MESEDVIKDCLKLLKDNHYKPTAIWLNLDGTVVYVVTDDIDRSEYATLIKKFKKNGKNNIKHVK